MAPIHQSQLKHLLNFDPMTRTFTWKNPTSRRVRSGDIAGFEVAPGVTWIKICGVAYPADRLANLYEFNDWYAPRQPRNHDLTASAAPCDISDPHAVKHAQELAEAYRQRLLARTAARTKYKTELTRIEWEYLDMVKYLKQSERLVRKEREQHNFQALNKPSPHENPHPLPLA
jgi:hypothetical protein